MRTANPTRTFLLGLLCALFAFSSAPAAALAAFDHSEVEKEFSVSGCGEVLDVAVAESNQLVYVACRGAGFGSSTIKRFDYQGNPAPFAASAPYLSGNEIVGSPSNPSGSLGAPHIGVDNSSVHPGYLYVVTGETTAGGSEFSDVFKPSGEKVAAIAPSVVFEPTKAAVDVGPDGKSYMINTGFGGHAMIRVYDATFHEIERVYTDLSGLDVAVDSTDALWAIINDTGSPVHVSKYEANQRSTDLTPGWSTPAAVYARLKATPSPFFPDPLTSGFDLRALDVELGRDDLYIDRGSTIQVYSQGTPEEPAFQNAPEFGSGTLSGSSAIAVTEDHRVFASSGVNIVRFGPGNVLPDVTTNKPLLDDIGHTTAHVSAHIALAGGGPITSCKVEYGQTTSYGQEAGCSPDPSASPPASYLTNDADVTADLSALTTGRTYHYRFSAGNADGDNFGVDRTVKPAFVLKVRTEATDGISDHGASVHGSLDPDGAATTYHFEYGVDTDYGLITPETSAGSDSGVIGAEAAIGELSAGQVWHYRLVATNAGGTTVGQDETFRTAAAPDLSGVRTSEVTSNSALLHARIDPNGYATHYHFDYGTTSEYGSSIPVPDADIPADGGPVDVEQRLEGLLPGTTYHFRVVATNEWGTTESLETTIDFSPPPCPNDHVRQQTQSSYLPDCRAYELVSPAKVGAILLQPGQQLWERSTGQNAQGYLSNWPQNSGYATVPSRFSFWGVLGAVSGLDGKIMTDSMEMYVATRTTGGWVTTLPGYKSAEALEGARHQCSEAMDVCLEHDEGSYGAYPQQQAPSVFDVDGQRIDQLPTNVNSVPGGEQFVGSSRASADFSHFVFGSSNVVFAPGGRSGGLGSAYDNDVGHRTLRVISKMPNGEDIAQDGPDSEWQRFEFPGVSPDGSHILMQTPHGEGGFHFYMRVDDAVTYDVTRGAAARFVGMTRDGSRVYFTTAAALTPEDDDTSLDLYLWQETASGDELKVVSQGNSEGNVDECASTFSSGCGIAPLNTEHDHPFELPSLPGTDDLIAEGSGDVYFYSPEQLDASRPGIRNQKNLYLYRGGSVRLVATLAKGSAIERMQISPNGAHAAMVTRSQLTSYDNRGRKEMYSYDADARVVRCVSCSPDGLPPESDVTASEGGRFMADDGRAFFATREALVPRDTDGTIIDVYEYAGGRPQLISSGVGSKDFTGGSKVVGLFFGGVNTGLEAVSHSGGDVFFSTYDTLVSQDKNGEFVKFYDARTGGGFPDDPELGPCAAADECHGADTAPPAPPQVASAGNLGRGSNLRPAAKKHRRHVKHRHHRKKKQRHGRAHKAARHSHG